MNAQLSSISSTSMDDLTGIAGGADEFTEIERDLAPLLAAWDHAHPATADPEWRHLLDEITRPRITQAFYRLAMAAGN